MDAATDAVIQRCVAGAFKGSTLVVIAHRLRTVMDFDRIVVMGSGRVLEAGKPARLLANAEGPLSEMVSSLGGAAAAELRGLTQPDN